MYPPCNLFLDYLAYLTPTDSKVCYHCLISNHLLYSARTFGKPLLSLIHTAHRTLDTTSLHIGQVNRCIIENSVQKNFCVVNHPCYALLAFESLPESRMFSNVLTRHTGVSGKASCSSKLTWLRGIFSVSSKMSTRAILCILLQLARLGKRRRARRHWSAGPSVQSPLASQISNHLTPKSIVR